MKNQIENLAAIKYCIENIEAKLLQNSLEDRWLWDVRLKIAQYVYSYLLLNDKTDESEQYILNEEQKQEIIKNHPLMQPFNQASIGVANEQRQSIQKEIYDRIHKMYFILEKSEIKQEKD
jgi:hypothetical protein